MPIPADYRELPRPELDTRRIEALWSFQSSSEGEHLVLPDGRVDLIARYRLGSDDPIDNLKLTIVGPSQCPVSVPVAAGDRFLGVRFRAGWGGVSLNIDPTELRDAALTNEHVDTILGKCAERLKAAKSEHDLEVALLATTRALAETSAYRRIAPEVVAAIDLLHLTGGRITLPDLARASGIPERTLRRRVGEAVGLSIKSLAAVLRFQRTMRLLAQPSGTSLSLAQAALEGGYSDQAHMSREFRRYGGFTPGRRPPVAFGSLPLSDVAEIFKRLASKAA